MEILNNIKSRVKNILHPEETRNNILHGNLRNNLILASGMVLTYYNTVKYPIDPLDVFITNVAIGARILSVGNILSGIVRDGVEIISAGKDFIRERNSLQTNPDDENSKIQYENSRNALKFVFMDALRNLSINSMPLLSTAWMSVADGLSPDYHYELEFIIPSPEIQPTPDSSI